MFARIMKWFGFGRPKGLFDSRAIPSTLDDCIDSIYNQMTEDDREKLKHMSGYEMLHFTTGMHLRNNWGLWERNSPLVKWFVKSYGISHGDDISGMILNGVWHRVRGTPFKPLEMAIRFRKHWENYGVDPVTFNKLES